MSSTEPPSRNQPRNQSHETKSARDEITSKGKVEKISEVDSDETKKKKFASFMDEDSDVDEEVTPQKPSPFELYSGQKINSVGTDPDLKNVEEAIIPSPSYSPPPSVSGFQSEEGDDEVTSGALPQSDDFWDDVDLPPDQLQTPSPMQETTNSTIRPLKGSKRDESRQITNPKSEASPFGPPGKSFSRPTPHTNSKDKKSVSPLPSPFEEAARTEHSSKMTKKRPADKVQEERIYTEGQQIPHFSKQEKESGGQKGKEHKLIATEVSSIPTFPSAIQAAAIGATAAAVPYLSPSTIPLFFQMVGTMYVMSGPKGINSTEFILNSPAYSNSKFFGSTITIEKYATAPDSFNIRLSGNEDAVNVFKDHIPSLMGAFESGNHTFKVNRIDVEYKVDKPVYRRKEGQKGRDEGDLGERRK